MNPAEQLKGMVLDNGWTVVDIATRKPNASGGTFSKGYIVDHADGRKGFMKALDYTEAFKAKNTAEVFQAMTNAYVFEKNLCLKTAHLSRIAKAIDAGSIDNTNEPHKKVEYLIFERASGDVRAHLDLLAKLDLVFVLKTLHNVATGLQQLHSANIAHQDLKPSNVLVYEEKAGSKICDLGRAWDLNSTSPFDDWEIAGDSTYAPIDALYREAPVDGQARRFGCDLYHLGSLIVFLFTRTHTNALINDNLHVDHRPFRWGGSYCDVLPFIQAAFDKALLRFAVDVPEFAREELQRFVSEMCNPDPARRGSPAASGSNRFKLDRYISRFDRLAHVARLQLVA